MNIQAYDVARSFGLGAFMVFLELIYITDDIPAFLEKFPNWKEAVSDLNPLAP